MNIFEACRQGDTGSIEELIATDPSLVNAADFKGFTPLILAAYNGQAGAAALLLQKGANPDAGDAAGNTALMGVAFKGYHDIAVLLLEGGAGVNTRNSNGATALTFAATFGHLSIARLLLERGADTSLADARGKKPFDHARIQENEEMMALIGSFAS